MRALVIDAEAKEKIQKVIKYAEEHVFSIDDLKAIIDGTKKPSGDIPGFRCHLERGYRVVFTIEDHPPGRFRHISVSVDEIGKLPSVAATMLIMQEFLFKSDIGECKKYTEELGGGMLAINLLEPIAHIEPENQ